MSDNEQLPEMIRAEFQRPAYPDLPGGEKHPQQFGRGMSSAQEADAKPDWAVCLEYRPDHNGECLNCDEYADMHEVDRVVATLALQADELRAALAARDRMIATLVEQWHQEVLSGNDYPQRTWREQLRICADQLAVHFVIAKP